MTPAKAWRKAFETARGGIAMGKEIRDIGMMRLDIYLCAPGRGVVSLVKPEESNNDGWVILTEPQTKIPRIQQEVISQIIEVLNESGEED